MAEIRLFIYKIRVDYRDGSNQIYTLATADREQIPILLKKNLSFINSRRRIADAWKVVDELNPFSLSKENYEQELAFVDFRDNIHDDAAPSEDGKERYHLK